MTDTRRGTSRMLFGIGYSTLIVVAALASTMPQCAHAASHASSNKPRHIQLPPQRAEPSARLNAAGSAAKTKLPLSVFAQESRMNGRALIGRWKAFIDEASKRAEIPSDWIRAVMMQESGGRTMLAENTPITSSMGAMGLMQLMPETWREMQHIYKLGPDPYDPHDNILAGAAYLHTLYWEYGYPGMFAAYNDGPGMIEAHRRLKQMLPAETAQYVLDIASILRTGSRGAQFSAPRAPPVDLAAQSEDEDDGQRGPPVEPLYAADNDDDYYHEQRGDP